MSKNSTYNFASPQYIQLDIIYADLETNKITVESLKKEKSSESLTHSTIEFKV